MTLLSNGRGIGPPGGRVPRLFSPLAGGVLFALGFPNPLLPAFPLFPVAGCALLLRSLRPGPADGPRGGARGIRRGLASSWAFCLGFSAAGLHWVPRALGEFGVADAPLNWLMALAGLPLAAYPQAFVLALLLGRGMRPAAPGRGGAGGTALPAALAALLDVVVPQLFPANPGHSWMALAPGLGLAPLLGVPAYSFFSWWLAFDLAGLGRRRGTAAPALRWLPKGAFLAFAAANLLFPLPPPGRGAPDGDEIVVRTVQPNVGNLLKVGAAGGDFDSVHDVQEAYRTLSAGPGEVDLIVWPETAFPNVMRTEAMRDDDLRTPYVIGDATRRTGAWLLTGGYDGAGPPGSGLKRNAAVLFDDGGVVRGAYHKTRLLPFGEAPPLGALGALLWARLGLAPPVFVPGERPVRLRLPGGRPFIAVICYEALFPSLVRSLLAGPGPSPGLIVNLVNDSWYGDTSEPEQHLFLAKWRAVETGLPVVRSANTGITAVLRPDGSEGGRMGVGLRGAVDHRIPLPGRGSTPWTRWGLLMPLSLVLAVLLAEGILLRLGRARPARARRRASR